MTIATDTRIVFEEALTAFGAAVLREVGVPVHEAQAIVENLVQADLQMLNRTVSSAFPSTFSGWQPKQSIPVPTFASFVRPRLPRWSTVTTVWVSSSESARCKSRSTRRSK